MILCLSRKAKELGQLRSAMRIEVIGVYSVPAREPCHLVELWVRELTGELPVSDFTQEMEGTPRDSWQVPWDERVLNESGTSQIGKRFPLRVQADGSDLRLAFFFDYLDFSRPLLTPAGPLELPAPTKRPSRLQFFEYESP